MLYNVVMVEENSGIEKTIRAKLRMPKSFGPDDVLRMAKMLLERKDVEICQEVEDTIWVTYVHNQQQVVWQVMLEATEG